jgi:AcrR family transcriptional regulator
VLSAALALADHEGLEALTMRRLAAELCCGVMTLYSYVRDREDLLSGVVALLIAEVDAGHATGSSWQDDLRRGAASYRAMALRHPRAFPALALASSSDPGLRAHVRRIVDGLKEGGFDEPTARELFSVVDSFGSGFLLMELSEPEEPAEDDPLEPLDEAAYWRGFELIIAGAEAMLAPRPR